MYFYVKLRDSMVVEALSLLRYPEVIRSYGAVVSIMVCKLRRRIAETVRRETAQARREPVSQEHRKLSGRD